MTKISSRQTFFLKRVFPVLWYGILCISVGAALASGAFAKDPMFIVPPAVMAVLGYFVMRKLIWGLMDEVYDCGDTLLVRNRGEQESVPLTNIMNVSASTATNPRRIALRLVKPGKFGNEIAFTPLSPFTLKPFAKNAVAEDLMARVDAARSKRR
jgi:hypothetical protein